MASNLIPEGFEVEYSPNEIPEGFEIEEQKQEPLGEFGYTEISTYKKPSVVDNLKSAFDFVTQVPVTAFQEQKKNNEAAELRVKGMYLRTIGQDLSAEEKAKIKQLDNPYNVGRYNQANNYGVFSRFKQTDDGEYFDKGSADVQWERLSNGAKRLYADAMKQTAIMYSTVKDAGIGAVVGMVGGAAVGGVAGAYTTKTPQGALQGAAQGGKTGATLLARTAVAKKVFELEAGFMRQELEMLNNEFIESGIEPLSEIELDRLSMATGALNAGLEYVGLNAVLKTFPQGEKLLKSFGTSNIKKLAKDATFREQLKAIAADLTRAGIAEGSTEMLQETTNFLAGNVARGWRDVEAVPLSEKVDEIMYSGLVGTVSAITMGGAGTTTQVVAIKTKQGIDKIKAQKEAEAMNIDERNEFINENIETLAEVAIEQADEKIKTLQTGDTYARIKGEMEKQGADSTLADNAAQLVQQAHNVILDKFGEEGRQLLEKSNLQILINQNNTNQINKETRFVDNTLKNRETQTFKPSELKTDAKTFQYKENSDKEGVTDRMNGVEEFDPLFAGKIIVYQTKSGEKFIVDGHQRLGLAKRTGGDNIELEGFLFKEEDGYTPEQVRVLAAQKNIAEGSGTAVDTAKIIKEIGYENLPKTIPTNSAMVKDGIALAKLGDTAFQKVINGEITAAQGARIASVIREDEAKQLAAIEGVKIANFNNLEQVTMFAREVLAADTVQVEQINLFGTYQLFETTAIEKIQIVDRAIRSLKSDKKIFSGLLRNNSKISGRGKNRLDKTTNERINQQAAVAIDLIEKLASRQGIISDKAIQLAGMVKREEISMDEAVKEFKAFALSEEVLSDIWGKTRKEIFYNQAALSRALNEEQNDIAAISEITTPEDSLITPEEFYRNGLYQAANVDDIYTWKAKYPDIAEALAEQDRLKAEGKLPSTDQINTEERKRLRVKIAQNMYGKGAKNKNKQAYLVIGLPASGKSSMANPLRDNTGSLIVDSDDAKERLPEFIESNGRRADQVHLESQMIAEKVLEKAIENGDNLVLPIVGKSEKSIMSKYDRLTAAGYDVHLRLVDLPIEKTIQRAVSRYRETGRLVPIDYITNEVGYKPVQNYVIMEEKGLFKSYEAYSTDVKYGEDPKQITTEEVINRLHDRGYGLQQDESNRADGVETRSVRGRSNDSIVYYQNSKAATDTAAFKEWFADSKVVDENGKPLVVYHGTADIIEAFDERYAGDTTGNNEYGAFFFTDNLEVAEDYSRQAYIRRYEGRDEEELQSYYKDEFNLTDEEVESIIEDLDEAAENQIKTVDTYLKIENPLIINNNYNVSPIADIQELIGWAKNGNYSDIVEKYVDLSELEKYDQDDIEEHRSEIEERAKELYGLEEDDTIEEYMFDEAMREIMDENGIYPETQEFDGIIIRNTIDDIGERSKEIQDTYIVFQPEQIKSIYNRGTFDSYDPNIYHQDEEAPRGRFRIDEDGAAIIDILENGDPSTIVHELGHFYLYSLEQLAQTNRRAEKELKEVNSWLGKADDVEYTQDELREFHEKFARGFEAYLMEGAAPTKSLLSVFRNFKDWLRDVYTSTKKLNVEFSESARMLFERVFTTDEEYEKEVAPKYMFNYAKAIELEAATNNPHYKFKKGLYDAGKMFSEWYDKLFIPIETRLGKISPELKEKLRNHTAQLALITGKDLKAAADFIKKTEAMKAISKEDYYKLDLALKNRDEYMVKILADKYGFKEEFAVIRDILEDIYASALEVGIDIGYLDDYYPRLVKHDMTEKYIEYIESLANKEQMDVINQVIKLEDAKISKVLKDLADADKSQFWSTEDKAKFINNHIRGFGKNNILLSRNASLKFERTIDELDANFNQFYETFEPALINYISNSRKTIEARKFFGSEYKEVGKLRARIKRKKKTLEEVEERTPYQAKGKEIERIKYELSPIKIKLEQLERRENLPPELEEFKEGLKKKAARLESQIEFVEKIKADSVKNMVKKRLREEIKTASEEITKILGSSESVEDSIGALVTKLAQNGDIYAKDEKLIRDMLLARFNASRVAEPIKIVRDLSYIATLNDFTNALTQFGDLAFSVYKYGFEDTFKGLKKPFEITREDLGINDMAHEFSNPSALSKWLKKQFQFIGLSAIDGLGKNTIIQASLLNAQKKAKSNNAEFSEKLKRIYGKDAETVKADLANGNITDDTIIFAYHELSDIQPISEDQTTELYQSGTGYMKLFYTLKTYGIKALDVARQDIINNIQQGIMNKNKGQVKKGLQNLVRLQMLLWLFGVPIDMLKDLLSNRDINIFESMIDTLIPFFIISRYAIKDIFESGLGSAIVNFFTPPIAGSATKALSGKASAIKHIPLIGKPIYNWFIKDRL